MKLLTCIAISLCFSFQAFAQTADDGHDADRDALRSLARRYENAVNSGDLKPLADAIDPGASAVFITGDEVKGLDAMQGFFEGVKKKLGEGSSYTIKLDADATEFLGDVALAKGVSNEKAVLGSGQIYAYSARWTAVLLKKEGQWKALRLQVSLNPFDNTIIAAKISFRTWITGSIAALVGIVLGWLLGRRPRRPAAA